MARFDLGTSIKNPTVVPATAEGFSRMMDDLKVGRICAELADLYEQYLRGTLKKEEYHQLKTELKLCLPFYTPHAHFDAGYKAGDKDPVDSKKGLLDIDNFGALALNSTKSTLKDTSASLVSMRPTRQPVATALLCSLIFLRG